MRGAAIPVWIFINLLCFGMCGYLYLIWSQYWMYIEKQRLFNEPAEGERDPAGRDRGGREIYGSDKYVLNYYALADSNTSTGLRKNRRSAAVGNFRRGGRVAQEPFKSISTQPRPSTNVVLKSNGSPRFPNVHKPVLEFDNDKYICYDLNESDCDAKTAEYKELLLKEFHRVLMGYGNVFESGVESKNPYNVQYAGERSGARRESSGRELLCALRRVRVRVVSADDEPFRTRGFPVPAGAPLAGRAYNTCAVVSSAGTLLGSQLGQFIAFSVDFLSVVLHADSHDAVVRFNNAPTANFTEDVGSKTTLRVLNSQVVTKPEFAFLEDPMYRSVSLLIWDPANYSSTLEEWYQHPDFPLFPVYKRYLETAGESVDAWLLQPASLWALWATLQDAAPYRLRRHPPSSGFIGIWFALHRCGRVRVFEYVPSARAARRCHYYSTASDPACTLGAWHPLAMEKAFAEKIRDNPDKEVFQLGYIDIPGFRTVTC